MIAVTAALGLVYAGALTARADSGPGTIPECANVVAGAGTYDAVTGELHMEVRLLAEKCSGEPVPNADGTTTTTSATYALYVIKDKTWSGDPFAPDANVLNVAGPGTPDEIVLVSDKPDSNPNLVTQITAPGAHVITYDVNVGADNDPTVCVFSLVTGSTVTTREVQVANQPVDKNGNGTTSDDTHAGNGGETNKSKDKFSWGTTTQTQEVGRVDFFDRAPTELENEKPLESTECLPIDAATTVINQFAADVRPGQGYN